MKSIYIILLGLLSPATFADFNSIDSDNDGVIDPVDQCPDTSQLKKISPDFKYAAAVNQDRLKPGKHAHPVDKYGCEIDTDKDGVVDSKDYCPQDSQLALSKGIAINGCPKHSDFDGTPDYRDKCPGTPRGVRTDKHGCQISEINQIL